MKEKSNADLAHPLTEKGLSSVVHDVFSSVLC